MPHCQPYLVGISRKKLSCTSCCGIDNLMLSADAKQALLQERTRLFGEIVFSDRPPPRSIFFDRAYRYRMKREAEEKFLPRFDRETYLCPFLGFLSNLLPGCMIHPTRTGIEDSQNASFYGRSICQGYQCLFKERDRQKKELRLVLSIAKTPEDYSFLIANYSLYAAIKRLFPTISQRKQVLKQILQKRKLLAPSFRYPSGLEIYDRTPNTLTKGNWHRYLAKGHL